MSFLQQQQWKYKHLSQFCASLNLNRYFPLDDFYRISGQQNCSQNYLCCYKPEDFDMMIDGKNLSAENNGTPPHSPHNHFVTLPFSHNPSSKNPRNTVAYKHVVWIRQIRPTQKSFRFLNLKRFKIPNVLHKSPYKYIVKIFPLPSKAKFYLLSRDRTFPKEVKTEKFKTKKFKNNYKIMFKITGHSKSEEFKLIIKVGNTIIYKSEKFFIRSRRQPKSNRIKSDRQMWNPKTIKSC